MAACSAVAAIVVVLPQSGYATPDPSIDSVKREVAQLYHEAERASERYNTIRVELKQARSQLASMTADVREQQAELTDLRVELGAMVAAQAQSSPGGPTSQLLSSGDPDALLAGLAAVQAYAAKQADMLTSFEAQEDALRVREQHLQSQVDGIAAAKQDLAEQKVQIAEKSKQAERLLAELKSKAAAQAARQVHVVSRDAARPPTQPSTPPPPEQSSGGAQVAIDFALAQVGDPYAYGAAGPDSYDCSGLTMQAWRAAGVALPHASSAQLGYGTPVSASQMQPGDLVFYYYPISHVGLYLGDGQLVHAPRPGSSVEIVPVDSMPIAAVRHIG